MQVYLHEDKNKPMATSVYISIFLSLWTDRYLMVTKQIVLHVKSRIAVKYGTKRQRRVRVEKWEFN